MKGRGLFGYVSNPTTLSANLHVSVASSYFFSHGMISTDILITASIGTGCLTVDVSPRKHAYIILTLKTSLLYRKTGVYIIFLISAQKHKIVGIR